MKIRMKYIFIIFFLYTSVIFSGIGEGISEEGTLNSYHYILKRMIQDKPDYYNLSKHSWSFKNNIENMWPELWWGGSPPRFDYSKPPYPGNWPFPPINAHSKNFPDWPLFVKTFGENQCYYMNNSGVVAYRETAVILWTALKNISLNHSWRGSSGGFAISTFMDFDNRSAFLQKFPDLNAYTNLYEMSINDENRKVINELWVNQFSGEDIQWFADSYLTTPRSTLQDLKNQMATTLTDHSYLLLSETLARVSIHAVNPYKLHENSSGLYYVYIYDNNQPNSTTKYIEIDSIQNKWRYLFNNDYSVWRENGLFLSRPVSNYLETQTIPFTSQFFNRFSQDSLYKIVLNATNSDIKITDQFGRSIHFKDSSIVENTLNAIPIGTSSSIYNPPVYFLVPENSFKMQLNSFRDTSTFICFYSDDILYNYYRNDALNNQYDDIYFDSALTIVCKDGSNRNLNLKTVINSSNDEKIINILNLDISQNDSVRSKVQFRERLIMSNYGAQKSYNIYLNHRDSTEDAVFQYSNIQLMGNSTHHIIPDWSSLSSAPLQILIDEANNGTIDDTLYLMNQLTINDEDFPIPQLFILEQNYPNPFNPNTVIRFSIPMATHTNLSIYNLLGERVIELKNGWMSPGYHEVIFKAADLPSGIYLYRINAGEYQATKKMLLIK